MKTLTANDLREMFQAFFEEKGHARIPSASIIPENDPTVLFTTAGMHPLVPFLVGEKHPAGKRLVDVQKCLRTDDIDEVGDNSHCTFFEMLGNWSLGDYFKEDAIRWSWEFLTDEKWLGIDPDRLVVSLFEGDEDCPRDLESNAVWLSVGMPQERIFFLPKKNNWWGPAGQTGPCGPDTEMFIDTGKPKCSPECSPACDCGKYLEIWNDVFMQYQKTADGKYLPLEQKNVDTGMGLERTVGVLQGHTSIYESELFTPIIRVIEEYSGKKYGQDETVTRAMRIIADHMRTAVFVLGDEKGVAPSNVDQGYILRRLIRRSIRFGRQIELAPGALRAVANQVIENYRGVYPELSRNAAFIHSELEAEQERFERTVAQGIREFDKLAAKLDAGAHIAGVDAFHLYDTYGFPIEMTMEMAAERGFTVDIPGFDEAFAAHQKLSQAGASQRFKGGLADNSEQTSKLHSATHLLHAALRKVLGDTVAQKGSNITAERLRFDFSFGRKMTKEEVEQVQTLVNEAIGRNLAITMQEMTVEEATQQGAIGLFGSRYGEHVKVYTMGDFSKEICGGPHAENTGDLGTFIIQKEEASSSGVRRIRAVLQ